MLPDHAKWMKRKYYTVHVYDVYHVPVLVVHTCRYKCTIPWYITWYYTTIMPVRTRVRTMVHQPADADDH
jgi:hypothetical protein